MKKLLLYLILIIAASNLVSCMTAKKATQYMKAHPEVSAKFCAEEYPVKETVEIIIQEDTAGAKKVRDSLQRYADSLLQIAEQKNASLEGVNQFIDEMIKNSSAKDSALQAIRAQLAKVPRTDINALRKSIEAELKAKVKPCKDSVITIVKENTARVKATEIERDEWKASSNKYESKRDNWRTIALISIGINLLLGVLIYFRRKIGFVNSILSK